MSDKWGDATAGSLAPVPLSEQFRLQASEELVWEQNGDLKEEALGLGKGDICNWTKFMQLADYGTPRPLDEDKDPPRAEAKEIKASSTVLEYGRSVGWTKKLEDLSRWNIRNARERILHVDQVMTIETLVYNKMITGKHTACVTGSGKGDITFTQTGVIGATGSDNLTVKSAHGIIDYMETKLIPKIGSSYRAILSSAQLSDLVDDLLEFTKYTSPGEQLKGEMGMLYNCRFMKDNYMLGSTVTSEYQGVFFGDDAISACIARPAYLAFEPGRFDRMPELAWFTIRSYEKTWDIVTDDAYSVGAANLKGVERLVRLGSKP